MKSGTYNSKINYSIEPVVVVVVFGVWFEGRSMFYWKITSVYRDEFEKRGQTRKSWSRVKREQSFMSKKAAVRNDFLKYIVNFLGVVFFTISITCFVIDFGILFIYLYVSGV